MSADRAGSAWAVVVALSFGACARASTAEPPTRGLPAAVLSAAVLPAAVLDDFDDGSPWQARASDDVLGTLERVPGLQGSAIGLTFDFRGHGGYAAMGRPLPIELPENYEVSLYVRGDAPSNDLQIKLLDASGDNVWWFRKRDFSFSKSWQRITFTRRQLEFAWGPTQDRDLRRAAALELVVAAGSGGGRGSVAFDGLSLRELPPVPAVPPTPIAVASSSLPQGQPALALDGRLDSAWRSASGGAQRLELDLGYARELGGLVLRWAPGAQATSYDVELSADRQRWHVARRVTEGNGGTDALLLPESEARFIRLSLRSGPGSGYALGEVEIENLAFGASPNAFVSALAREAPRGRYPRSFVGEQSYWTLVGVDAGSASGLLSEDGAIELGRGGASVEPFVVMGGEVISWADVDIAHSLLEGYLPIPSVTWRHPKWELRVTTFALGPARSPELGARYELWNLTSEPLSVKLVLALRPLQVNPPTQSLNLSGGVSEARELRWDGASLWVNGARSLVPLAPPDDVALASFDATELAVLPPSSGRPGSHDVEDATGLASGALVYELALSPRQMATVGLVAPLARAPAAPGGAPISSLADLSRAQAEVAAGWRAKLNRVTIEVPPEGQPLVDTLRSSLAHILMSREGPVLRPGTRSYARSWIRDGAMIAESLLRLGHEASVAEYLDWYAPHQFESGKVPCCVDERGADPVAENDSPGELIFLAAELYRMTRDRARLERVWPHVEAAARYLEQLRQSERTAKNQAPERRALYGLLPPSISHEGYSDKPAYSYWDNFWALIGYQDAAWLAEVLAQPAADRLSRQRDEFRQDLYASLLASAAQHGVSFIPGAADRGDFDATSTTIALAPGREGPFLPRALLLPTFERYWQEFVARRAGTRSWDAYTPYELRVAGSFIRLGWRERAQGLFAYFLADRRPLAWNQWAEVVGRDARQPRFVGDMPHAWIASDYIRSALDVFAYAREADQLLVLCAGVPPSWFDGPGLRVRGLRTSYGLLNYSVVEAGRKLELRVSGPTPPGGFAFPWPWPGAPASARVRVNGERTQWTGGELRFRKLPARVLIERD